MARMIDPSELEGDDLVNWYRRSPTAVEVEREAGRQDQHDAFVNSIGAASEPPDNSAGEPSGSAYGQPQEGSDNSGSGQFGPNDGPARRIEARYFRPFAAPVMPPAPSGLRVGPPLDTLGAPPVGAPASGFFGQHDYSSALGGYYTDLPSPLNIVHATPTGWWEINDGRRVQTDEVERIYAEQKRRLKGQVDAEPAVRLRAVNRLPDGQIPRTEQVARGERELDPTCAPNGGWERDSNFENYSVLSKRYQSQITHAPGLD